MSSPLRLWGLIKGGGGSGSPRPSGRESLVPGSTPRLGTAPVSAGAEEEMAALHDALAAANSTPVLQVTLDALLAKSRDQAAG